MARRRRRLRLMRITSHMLASVLLWALLVASVTQCAHHSTHVQYSYTDEQPTQTTRFQPQQQQQAHPSTSQQQQSRYNQQHLQAAEALSSQAAAAAAASALPSVGHLCARLPAHTSKHLKLCKLIASSAAADAAVAHGASKGLAECRAQFKSDRWNCTHARGEQNLLTSELAHTVGNRESGFVHAIAAAGIVHSIAWACSAGTLADCACDKTRVGLIRRQDENWKWGGCSNNVRHGMLFAKHLVELLDASHEHERMLKHNRHSNKSPHHAHSMRAGSANSRARLGRRSANKQLLYSATHATHLRYLAAGPAPALSLQNTTTNLQSTTTTTTYLPQSFCLKNHTSGMPQAAHVQLVKSLLARNSLERHQDIRLAMNMHNNKVGRMAVAKNMELRCRCHGLSGSCSLKTCWLALPSFDVIGAYLRRKYDTSVHLPSAVNVNKLIPMMDRDEIGAILAESASSGSVTTATAAPAPEYAALVSSSSSAEAQQPQRALSGHFLYTGQPSGAQQRAANSTGLHDYYERHKQQLEHQIQQAAKQAAAAAPAGAAAAESPQEIAARNVTSLDLATVESVTATLAPITQHQYQTLLKDMRLCSGSSGSANASDARPSTKQQQWALATKNTAPLLAANAPQGQQLKAANQQLSHMLHASNKDDLIHLHKSPDYCEPDERQGYAGIESRECSDIPWAPNNCDKLCCGRGYSLRVHMHVYDCDCQFQWCCEVQCSKCRKEIKMLMCN